MKAKLKTSDNKKLMRFSISKPGTGEQTNKQTNSLLSLFCIFNFFFLYFHLIYILLYILDKREGKQIQFCVKWKAEIELIFITKSALFSLSLFVCLYC